MAYFYVTRMLSSVVLFSHLTIEAAKQRPPLRKGSRL
jgi:hypothetical protein